MFLKRRNYIALILLLLATLCWTFGQRMLTYTYDIAEDSNINESSSTTTGAHSSAVTSTSITNTMYNEENLQAETTMKTITESTQSDYATEETGYRTKSLFGYILSFIAVVAAVISIIEIGRAHV